MFQVLSGALTLCVAAIVPRASSGSFRLILLLFLAISPGAVWYAREARSYALLLLLSAVITLTSTSLVQYTQSDDRKARLAIGMLIAASVLRFSSFYVGFFDLLSFDGQASADDRRPRCLLRHCMRRALDRIPISAD